MKKILTKIGYMAFGSLLTLIGYHFGNVDNNTANAQQAIEKTDNIVDNLRVRQLEIVGNDNSPRIYLGTNLDKGQIVVVDDNDVPHLTLKTHSEGGRIEVQDNSGKDRIMLGVSKENAGLINVLDANTSPIVGIGSIGKDNGGMVEVYSAHAKRNENGVEGPSASLAVLDDVASVSVFSKTKKSHVMLFTVRDGSGVEIKDEKNIKTILHSDAITIYNSETKKAFVQSGVTDSGEGYVSTFDKDGKQVNSIGNTGESIQTHQYNKTIRRSVPITGVGVQSR